MIIDCISDLHGYYPKLEGGDLLIVAGDLTAKDDEEGWLTFERWLYNFNFKYKQIILIAGNHDNSLQSGGRHCMRRYWEKICIGSNVTYLCDSGTEFVYWEDEYQDAGGILGVTLKKPIRKALKIWGSPWTLKFKRQNPKAMAFTVDTEEELAEKWALIPDDIDILVTHGPPKFGLDKTAYREFVGSESLRNWVFIHQPQIHVFGHIHESYGIITKQEIQDLDYQITGKKNDNLCLTTIINASHVNEYYEPVNKPIRVIL